ncbi:hypothetical protein QBC39DRAFT_93292 [Podospora conica]|nr:hypothetical protein QBC39DRAFT_93292 [Schizothecium conicum]
MRPGIRHRPRVRNSCVYPVSPSPTTTIKTTLTFQVICVSANRQQAGVAGRSRHPSQTPFSQPRSVKINQYSGQKGVPFRNHLRIPRGSCRILVLRDPSHSASSASRLRPRPAQDAALSLVAWNETLWKSQGLPTPLMTTQWGCREQNPLPHSRSDPGFADSRLEFSGQPPQKQAPRLPATTSILLSAQQRTRPALSGQDAWRGLLPARTSTTPTPTNSRTFPWPTSPDKEPTQNPIMAQVPGRESVFFIRHLKLGPAPKPNSQMRWMARAASLQAGLVGSPTPRVRHLTLLIFAGLTVFNMGLLLCVSTAAKR